YQYLFMTYKKNKEIVKKPAVLQTKKYLRVKAEHEVQEQKPLKIKEKYIISNQQIRCQLGDISNSKGSSNMINKNIGSTDSKISNNKTYNFSPLSQPENFQFFVKQLPKDFYNAKLSLFYSSKDLLFFSDNNNKNDNIRSNKNYKTEKESEEEDVINFDTSDVDDSPVANI
ncbi:3399_t:CDS:2, partial [Scutellospora calospora]